MIGKRTWLFVGVFLWGIPTGFLFSLFLTIARARHASGWGHFEISEFWNIAFIFVPLFSLFGVIMGLLLHKFGQHHSDRQG